MSIFDTFKTSPKAETEGVWKDFPANKDGTVPAFRIARMAATNPAYQKRLEAIAREFRTELTLDVFTEEQSKEPMLEVFVDTILIDWRNIQRNDGTVIEYSKDAAKALMNELPDLYTLLREYAAKISTFRETELLAKAGN